MKERMAEIGFWALPPNGTSEYTRIVNELRKRESPEVKQYVKKTIEKAISLIEIQKVNGLGFSADKMLREYNLEYNGRVLNGSIHDLPGSFNVAEAFNKFIPPSATFELLEEIDHIFSFDEFIDFITSGEFNSSAMPSLEGIKDGKIYSYNSSCDPLEITFSTENNKIFGFSSVSFIKFGSEVSIILVAGQECNLEDKTDQIKKEFENIKILSHKKNIKPSSEFKIGATPLSENSSLLKSIVLTRIDLKKQTFDVRYVYEDWGQSYTGYTDDISVFMDYNGNFFSPEVEDSVKTLSETMSQYQALFELCKTCMFLPEYFEQFGEDINVERHPTKFVEFRKKQKNQKHVLLVDNSYKIPYREPYVLIRNTRRSPARAEFITPEISVETSGFWKSLSIQAQGRDKNGNPITGRTWVKKTLSWCEEQIKDSTLSFKRKNEFVPSDNAGFIYVMRSAAHQKDIFKIGLTKRDAELRSMELSRSTSSPDHFLVVEEWYVRDCILAEKLIHEKLESYRVNPKREYFKARYSLIFSAIDDVITKIENS